MGLFSRKKPKIKTQKDKRGSFDGWVKCDGCSALIHQDELGENLHCCPKCNWHYRIGAKQRLNLLLDANSFKEHDENLSSKDPLKFVDTEKYKDRLKKAQKKTGQKSAIICGSGLIENQPVAIGVLDFSFMGGSMGSVVGEKITRLIEWAIENHHPVIIVSASGGARMQESILSLMQMAKTSAALAKLGTAGLPFISLLTHPTTGGVTASFATLGDVIIAEPGALIGFAGPRVVEQTTREKLPENAQRAEFLLECGMVDMVCARKDLKKKIATCIGFLLSSKPNNNQPLESVRKVMAHYEQVPAR